MQCNLLSTSDSKHSCRWARCFVGTLQSQSWLSKKEFHSPISPTFCNRCRDAVEKRCDPLDEFYAIDALWERLRLKGYDLKRKINQLHSSIIRQLAPDVMSTFSEFCLPDFTDNKRSPYTKKGLSSLLSLGAICSYWRDCFVNAQPLVFAGGSCHKQP